jgi:hypothetical protein
MFKRSILCLIAVVFVIFGLTSDGNAGDANPGIDSLRLVFESNFGQAASPYKFVSRHGEMEALFLEDGVDLLVVDRSKTRSGIQFRMNGARAHVVP